MYKALPVILLCYACFVAFVLIQSSEADVKHYRNKRFLAFLNSSRFYLKFNVKDNMVPWNQLFAQAIGFRMNWDQPPMTFRPFHRLYRRNVYNYVETLLDKNGLSGFHCVRRAVCEIQIITEPKTLYHRILTIIFRKISSDTERWHNATEDECIESTMSCPFSLLEVSRYTDIS